MTALTDEQIYEQLKNLPDFDRLPLPKYFYEKFNIPEPKIQSMMEAIHLMNTVANAPGPLVITEHREPAPGGLRPLIDVAPVEMEIQPIVDAEVEDDKESE